MARRAPNRLRTNLLFVSLGWPLYTIVAATLEARLMPYQVLTWLDAFAGALAGTALLLPEMALIGCGFALLSWATFRRRGLEPHWSEPATLFVSMSAGAALWYPGILAHPIFVPVGELPAWAALAGLFACVAALAVATGRKGCRGELAIILLLVGVVAPLPTLARSHFAGSLGDAPRLVILGLDSISTADDVSGLRDWVRRENGAWYERAVTPGLLTNAVWASVLTGRPIRDHRIFATFQHLTPDSATLLRNASAKGYRTVSFFPDQLTCTVGSEAGFDRERSGPIGWRQLVLPIVADSSLLVSIVKPLLPDGWFASPSNLTGTFSYSVERTLREIATSAGRNEQTMAVGHVTYLHVDRYPASFELTRDELVRVWSAPAARLKDPSLHWQSDDSDQDAIRVREWKTRHLLRAVDTVFTSTKFLRKGGKLILFSDHGHRGGLGLDNFGQERYYHVVLATFGLPHGPLQKPVSLTEIGRIAGLTGGAGATAPAVEFTIAPQQDWNEMRSITSLRWNGDIVVDQGFSERVFGTLRRFQPWPPNTAQRRSASLN